MATYLGNGQYNLLDVINRSKDPSINYDGLYEDPSRDQGSYTSNPFKAATSSDFEYLNSKSLKSRNNRSQYNIFSPYDVPVNQRMRMDNMSYLNDTPLRNSYGGPQSSQFDNFDPRIGRPEVVSDFVAGDDGMYSNGNYPDNPYPDNTELGDMTGLVTDQFYDQMDKAPTMTDTIENNQYDVNDAALGIMENAFNQRQIMADETSVGNYPMEPVMGNINGVKSNAPLTSADYERMDPSLLEENQIGMTAEDLQNRQGILQGLQDKIGAGFNNVKDFAIDKGNMGRNLLGSAGAMAMGLPGIVGSGLMSLLSNLGDGADYQKYTPGFDYNGLNDSMINDFFDPATGLNRFDRARRKGNTFASARTGAEYFKLRREKKAVEAAAEAQRQSDLRTVQQRAARGDSYSDIGRDMYTGSGQAFEKQSGGYSGKKGTSTERNYGGRKDGGIIGYKDGGSTNGSGEKAFSAKVKELMDDGYEFGEAVKEAMKQGYMNGGRIKSYFKGGLVSLRGK